MPYRHHPRPTMTLSHLVTIRSARVALVMSLAILTVGLLLVGSDRLAAADSGRTGTIHVIVWDERQPEQKQVYDNFLGNAIADYLKTRPGFSVTSVCIDDPEQGLPDSVLNEGDVLVWWGHKRNAEVKEDLGKKIAARIQAGKLSLMCLHSAHWSRPFIASMNAVETERALATLTPAQRTDVKIVNVTSPLLFSGLPRREDPLTPFFTLNTDLEGIPTLTIALPICCFPAYRADGKPSHMTTLLRDHPIAKDIPATFDITASEMYDEPFHVPNPDQVVFDERWDHGEHFRSGMIWHLGKSNVVYFRPGHEVYPVYKQDVPLRIVENTCRWLFSQLPR